jgi:hypothetical protein
MHAAPAQGKLRPRVIEVLTLSLTVGGAPSMQVRGAVLDRRADPTLGSDDTIDLVFERAERRRSVPVSEIVIHLLDAITVAVEEGRIRMI